MLFAVYGLVGKRSGEAPEKIVVSASQITNLGDGFARTWRRPPSEEELQGLIENYIRDEVFYRAGRAAGLDRDDAVIRRRVRQKMEFLAEEISVPEPTEAQLGDFLASNPERFRIGRPPDIPPSVSKPIASHRYDRPRLGTGQSRAF